MFEELSQTVKTFFENEGVLLPTITLRRSYERIKAFDDDWWNLQDVVIDTEEVGVLLRNPSLYRKTKSERQRQLFDNNILLSIIYNNALEKVYKVHASCGFSQNLAQTSLNYRCSV
jgi:hypothetical protein